MAFAAVAGVAGVKGVVGLKFEAGRGLRGGGLKDAEVLGVKPLAR